MAPMEFHWLNVDEGEALWDQALTRFPGIYFSFLYGWRKVYEKALKLKTHYLLVEEEGQVSGLCPLIYMKSPWLGERELPHLPALHDQGRLMRARSKDSGNHDQPVDRQGPGVEGRICRIAGIEPPTDSRHLFLPIRNMSKWSWSCPRIGPVMKRKLPLA